MMLQMEEGRGSVMALPANLCRWSRKAVSIEVLKLRNHSLKSVRALVDGTAQDITAIREGGSGAPTDLITVWTDEDPVQAGHQNYKEVDLHLIQ